MSLLWEKSAAWRWMVRMTKESKPFFITFATLCGVVPGVIGYGVMQATSSRNEQLEAHLRKNARPETLMMGQVNRERLAEYLGEIQRKETDMYSCFERRDPNKETIRSYSTCAKASLRRYASKQRYRQKCPTVVLGIGLSQNQLDDLMTCRISCHVFIM